MTSLEELSLPGFLCQLLEHQRIVCSLTTPSSTPIHASISFLGKRNTHNRYRLHLILLFRDLVSIQGPIFVCFVINQTLFWYTVCSVLAMYYVCSNIAYYTTIECNILYCSMLLYFLIYSLCAFHLSIRSKI